MTTVVLPTEINQTLPIIPLDWAKIQTVFLDMDGTLLDLHFDNHFWLEHLPHRLATQKSIAPQDAKNLVNQHCDVLEGTLNWYCLDYWHDLLGVDLVPLKHEIADRIAVRAHVEAFLTHLKALNKRVILLTNAHQKSIDVKFNYINLAHYFDRIITSHQLGLAKEHPDFWGKLSTIESFDKQSSLFIDDNLQVLRSAKAYGVAHLLAIREPDSKLPPKDTAEFTALSCYTQLMHS